MSVYYAAAPELRMVKIGFAADPWHRFSKIQSDSPCALKMLAIEEGGLALEASRHAQFAQHRARREWFRLSPEIEAHIAVLGPAERPRRASEKGISALSRDAGISVSYASMIVSGNRDPSLRLAVSIFSKTGRRFGKLALASDSDIASLQRIYGAAA